MSLSECWQQWRQPQLLLKQQHMLRSQRRSQGGQDKKTWWLLPKPPNFDHSSRETEIAGWKEWSWSFEEYIFWNLSDQTAFLFLFPSVFPLTSLSVRLRAVASLSCNFRDEFQWIKLDIHFRGGLILRRHVAIFNWHDLSNHQVVDGAQTVCHSQLLQGFTIFCLLFLFPCSFPSTLCDLFPLVLVHHFDLQSCPSPAP